MKAKFVFEFLNEYVTRQESEWADRQIHHWEQQQKGIDPLKEYIKNVVNLIYDDIPDEILKYTATTKDIIEDIITAQDDWQLIDMNVYDFWQEDKSEEEAAVELGNAFEKLISGQAEAM